MPALKLKSLVMLRWRDNEGHTKRFGLRDRVSAKWQKFGLLLGLTVNELELIEMKNLGDASQSWMQVMQTWFDRGSSDYPATWQGLTELLEDLDYHQVSQDLLKALEQCQLEKGTWN